MDQATTCPYCNERPLGVRKNSRTCGDKACQKALNRRRMDTDEWRERMRENMRAKRAAGIETERMEDRTCETCGGTFRSRARTAQRFCSQKCSVAQQDMKAKSRLGRAALQSEVERICDGCSMPFIGTSRRRFCSSACRWFAQYAGASCDVTWNTCQGCGLRFARRVASQYCSTKCRWNRPRKWRKYAAEVYERDGMICQLCGSALSETWTVSDPLSPTLDHITPRSQGGADTPDNLRAAHFACNALRGDRAGVHRLSLVDALNFMGHQVAA